MNFIVKLTTQEIVKIEADEVLLMELNCPRYVFKKNNYSVLSVLFNNVLYVGTVEE